MPLAPGTRLGPYEILSPIGAGGMGEVYKARDTRLERTVAIKVSKQAFEQRFRDEALAVASLNHAHVAALYDVGPNYLVMEHVAGRPLRGPLPIDEALRLAGQIADALEHAHERGIVHRDLKPSNVLLAKDGVKILDFGIAKRLESRPSGDESGTTLTEAGSVSGTPRYMAPEQFDGKAADERTDIFSFGLVLYELLTGKHAFEGGSRARVMAAILEKEPAPLSALRPEISPALEKVIATCLAKDRTERWQSMRELKHALAWTMGSEKQRPRKGRRLRIAVVTLVVLVAGALVAIVLRRSSLHSAPSVELEIALPEKALFRWSEPLAVSADGQLAFSLLMPGELPRLFLRAIDSVALVPVPGGERGAQPFWSPDGNHLGFVAIPGGLKRFDRATGQVTTISPGVNTLGATWGRDDVIVFSDGKGLKSVPASGGEPRALGTLVEGELGRYRPHFLPDGRHYLYYSMTRKREERAVYVGALGSDLRKRIVSTEFGAAYSPPGRLLFVKDGALVSQPFDLERLELSGEPMRVLEGLALMPGEAGLAHFAVSANGVLAWRTGPVPEPLQLTWFDRSGRRLRTLGEPGLYHRAVLSPDERQVATCREDSATSADVWIIDVANGAGRRLTLDPGYDCGPVWSPDGAWIAFRSDRGGVPELFRKRADGAGGDERLLASESAFVNVTDWSADGRSLVYHSPTPARLTDLFLLRLPGSEPAEPIPFRATEAVEDSGAFSPNGRWLAYRASDHGRFEVYVGEVLPDGRPGPGRWPISSGGGWSPRWRRDGRELFYFTGTGVMAVNVEPGAAALRSGIPRRLFDPPFPIDPGASFDVTRDGQRFLLLCPLKPREPIRVLVNWSRYMGPSTTRPSNR